MARQEFFTLRVNQAERRMLENLAERLQRTQSDAVRLLIREAAREMTTEPQTYQTAVFQGVQHDSK